MRKRRRMEKWGYFQQHEKYRYHIARLFLYFGNCLRSIKREFGQFFKPKRSCKDGLVCVLLGCFHIFVGSLL